MAGRFPFDPTGGHRQLNSIHQVRAAFGLGLDEASLYLQHTRQQQELQQQQQRAQNQQVQQQQQQQQHHQHDQLQRDLQLRQLLLQEQIDQQAQAHEQQIRALGEHLQDFPELQQHYHSLLFSEQLQRRGTSAAEQQAAYLRGQQQQVASQQQLLYQEEFRRQQQQQHLTAEEALAAVMSQQQRRLGTQSPSDGRLSQQQQAARLDELRALIQRQQEIMEDNNRGYHTIEDLEAANRRVLSMMNEQSSLATLEQRLQQQQRLLAGQHQAGPAARLAPVGLVGSSNMVSLVHQGSEGPAKDNSGHNGRITDLSQRDHAIANEDDDNNNMMINDSDEIIEVTGGVTAGDEEYAKVIEKVIGVADASPMHNSLPIVSYGTLDDLLNAAEEKACIDEASVLLKQLEQAEWGSDEVDKQDEDVQVVDAVERRKSSQPKVTFENVEQVDDTNGLKVPPEPAESIELPGFHFRSALPALPQEPELRELQLKNTSNLDDYGLRRNIKRKRSLLDDHDDVDNGDAVKGAPMKMPDSNTDTTNGATKDDKAQKKDESDGKSQKLKKYSAVLEYPYPIDTWWPSLTGIRRERKSSGEQSDEDKFEDEDNAEACESPSLFGPYRANLSMIRKRLATEQEPGLLEKLPHCRIHRVRTKRKKNSTAPELVYCWQVSEVYPNDLMVNCSVCGTWRHAACGGHYKPYSTKENIKEPFVAVCEFCHEEDRFLRQYPAGRRRLESQRMEQLRRALATSAVMRHASFSKHGGTYKWPLGSVSATHIGGHTRSVHARHDKAEKQWTDMAARLGRGYGYRLKERLRSRTKELERLLVSVEDAEGYTDRHNMMLFLMADTAKKRPAGFETIRRNIFDPADDSLLEDDLAFESGEVGLQEDAAAAKEALVQKKEEELNVQVVDSEDDEIEDEFSEPVSPTSDDTSSSDLVSSSSASAADPDDDEAIVELGGETERIGNDDPPVNKEDEAATKAEPVEVAMAADVEVMEPKTDNANGNDNVAVGGSECNGNSKSQYSKCARKGCKRRRRFDSQFCSDPCGVAALEMDLLRTLQDASDIHPSILRL